MNADRAGSRYSFDEDGQLLVDGEVLHGYVIVTGRLSADLQTVVSDAGRMAPGDVALLTPVGDFMNAAAEIIRQTNYDVHDYLADEDDAPNLTQDSG